jgi:hypothetical protein
MADSGVKVDPDEVASLRTIVPDFVANGRPPIDFFMTVVGCYPGNQFVEL